MKIFCLHSQANDKMLLELNEVLGFLENISYQDINNLKYAYVNMEGMK